MRMNYNILVYIMKKRYEKTPVSSYLDRKEYLRWYYQLVIKQKKYKDFYLTKKQGEFIINFD